MVLLLKEIQTILENRSDTNLWDLINEGAYLFIHDPNNQDQIIKDLEVKPLDQNLEENSFNEKGSWKFITDINESHLMLTQ